MLFVSCAWLSSKYKNSFFFVFIKTCVANIRFKFRSSHQRCSFKKLFLEILQESYIHKYFDSESYLLILHRNQKGFLNPIYKNLKGMFETWPFSAERRNSVFFFCHSQISLICMIYLSLPNLYFYTFRSLTVFLKVLNKVYFIIIYYWLTPVRKTLWFELLAINHSSSEKRIILFLSCWSSPMVLFFYNLHGFVLPCSWVE